MKDSLRSRSPLQAAITLVGVLSAAIGLAVLIGWHTHTLFLIQWSPRFVPTGYATALGFLASGAGLIAVASNRLSVAMLCGGAALLVGGIALAMHLFGIDPGLGQILAIEHSSTVKFNPGRTSLNSSLSLIAIGVALLIMARTLGRRQPFLILGLLGALVIALALAVLFGHLRGLQTAYGWTQGARTGIVSITGFMLIGTGILAAAWHSRPWQTTNTLQWVAVVGGAGIVLLSMLLWWTLARHERSQFEHILQTEASSLGSEIGQQLTARLEYLERIALRQGAQKSDALHDWGYDAELYLQYYPGQKAIGWFDPQLDLLAARPTEQAQALLAAVRVPGKFVRGARRADGQSPGAASTATLRSAAGDVEFLLMAPVDGPERSGGLVASMFSPAVVLARILAEKSARGYAVAISDRGQILYQGDGRGGELDRAWGQPVSATFGDTAWQMRLWPQAGRLAKAQSNLPETALAVGFVIAILVMLVVQLSQAAQMHAASLEQSHRDLENEIAHRRQINRTLEKQTAELTRSNQELQQFAYVASHDLQEPLRMVVSYMQLIERRYKDKLDESGQEFIHYAVDGASRMQALIQSLLAYSRVGTKGTPFAPTALESVLEKAQFNLRIALEESGATIAHDFLPTVFGDEMQLVQLFQNLIGNALKFRDQEPPRIEISVADAGDAWQLTVRDNGIGFEPQYADRIFVIFQRLQAREDYPGTGIGLAICKKIVERHGGDIRAESEPGHGASFVFTLPKPAKAPSA